MDAVQLFDVEVGVSSISVQLLELFQMEVSALPLTSDDSRDYREHLFADGRVNRLALFSVPPMC